MFSQTLFGNEDYASDDPLEILKMLGSEEIVESEAKVATGIVQPLEEAPAIATVITAEEIEAMGATDIDDILETIPGLHVARDRAYNPIYTIRGIYSEFNAEILLMINGIPLKSLLMGNRTQLWGGMSVNAISRIEVIRGPGSAVYGADAFSGVINIITKEKKDIEGTEIGGKIGKFNTEDAWFLHGANWLGFDIAMTLEYHNSDGFERFIEQDIQTFYDTLFGTNISQAPGLINNPRRNIDTRLDISYEHWKLRLGYQGRNLGVATGAVMALADMRYSGDRITGDLTYNNPNFTENWDVTAQLSIFDSQWKPSITARPYQPGAFGGAFPNGISGDAHSAERHTRLNLSGVYSGFENHKIRIGTGYLLGDLHETKYFTNVDPITGGPLPVAIDLSDTSYVFQPEVARKNWHVFLQDAWKFSPNWELTTGVRYDDYSDFGTTINPRLALVWTLNSNFSTKLLYGHAFRAPTLNQVYATNNPMLMGNRDLDPEKIETGEIGFDYHPSTDFRAMLNLFIYEITDGIDYIPQEVNGQSIFAAQNTGSQKGYGSEFEVKWNPRMDLNITANYAYQKAEDKEGHDPGNAPRHQIYLRTNWQFLPYWYLNSQVNWVGERGRMFGDPRPTLDDYATMDLTLRRKYISNNLDFAMSVRNVFDADAREPSPGPDNTGIIAIPNDFPLSDRSYWLELRYRF